MPELSSKLAKDLGVKVKAAIDRADELGGDVRDYLTDRWQNDPRFAHMRDRVARMRGQTVAVAAPKPAAPTAVAAAPAAAPVAKVAQVGLGNPSLPAQIYGKKSCAWTGRAMTVLEKRNVDYDFIDMEEPEHEKYLPLLATETHQQTVPYVYLRGQFIGGYNALAEVERLGQLEFALMSPEQRAAAPAHLKMVEIAARPNTDEVAPAESEGSTAAE